MTMLRQIRSTGPMRAPCFRGLSLGHFMLKVYWVLFCCVPGTLAAPCLTCYGFQPGCTFETNGQCPMADIPVANLAITAKAGVGGALILQNAVSNKYNRVINREGLNSLQALMRRPFNGTPVAVTKTTTMKTILGWVQSGVCSLDWALMEYMELVETETDGDVRKRLMARNTGQVVAELKVVTSNKLCEPNASNCPNAPRHKHKERKHPRKKARTPKLLKLHEDAQRQSVERESASRPPPVLQLVGSQADS